MISRLYALADGLSEERAMVDAVIVQTMEECALIVLAQKISSLPTTDPWNVSLDLAAAAIRKELPK